MNCADRRCKSCLYSFVYIHLKYSFVNLLSILFIYLFIFHFNACIYIDLIVVSFFLVNVMDEISVDTPSDIPEEARLLFLITFDCI